MDESPEKNPLIAAAASGDLAAVESILAKGDAGPSAIDINAQDIDGRTALHHAARGKHHEIAKALLAVPTIDLSICDNRNWTPLTWAAALGSDAILADLIKACPPEKLDINAKDNDGRTMLSWAAGQGNEDVVKRLLAFPGIDVNAADPDNWTPLTYAVGHGHSETVRVLLCEVKDKVDPDPKDSNGWTPLFTACEQGYKDIVDQLLALGQGVVDVSAAAVDDGRTPLHVAADNGQEEIVRVLLETSQGRACLGVKSKDGKFPKDYAVGGGHEGLVKMFSR